MSVSDRQRYTVHDLLTLMAVLRDAEEGCPWDVEQHWDSIVPHTLEEAYEVADAIERRAFDELPGELGDLLFQVVYYAQFAQEEGRFDFADVVHTLTSKMIARHPHVFPEGTLSSRRQGVPAAALTQADVDRAWEQRKGVERAARAPTSAPSSCLDDIPHNLPALTRAQKLGKRAGRLGFDWPTPQGALDKVREELAEVVEAMDRKVPADIEDELGDLLLAVSSVCRHLEVDAEQALRRANAKFERRFRQVERAVDEGAPRDLDTLESLWQAAKLSETY